MDLWTTPQAHDTNPRGAGNQENPNGGVACLAWDAKNWATPRASDAEKGGPNQSFGAGGTPLPAMAAQWMTPNVPNGGRSANHAEIVGRTAIHNGKKVQIGLEHQTRLWTTPCADDTGTRTKRFAQGGTALSMQATTSSWGTPTARDHKDGGTSLENVPINGLLGRQVLNFPSPHLAPPIPDGPRSSPEPRSLNPLFVEWLMACGQSGGPTAALR